MEVDLTYDDMVITTPLDNSKSIGPSPQTAKPPMTPVETVDITDDDDIICEDDPRFKQIPNQSQDKVLLMSAPAPKSIHSPHLSQEARNNQMEVVDDDVIEVIESSNQTSSNREKDKVFINKASEIISKPPTTLMSHESKESSCKNTVKTDGIIEVIEPICNNTLTEKTLDSSQFKTKSVSYHLKDSVFKNVIDKSLSAAEPEGMSDIQVLEPTSKLSDNHKPSSPKEKWNTTLLDLLHSPSKDMKEKRELVTDDALKANQLLLEPSKDPSSEKNPSTVHLENPVGDETCGKSILKNQSKGCSDDSGSRYVVDITEEDDSKKSRKRKSENSCLNPNCQSGEDLALAPMFVTSYFGCKLVKGKYEVCSGCYEIAVDHHKNLADRLLLHQPLFTYENFPVNDIPVVDLESDEETSEPEDSLPFSVLQDVEAHLEDVLKESLSKFDLDYQITEATGFLNEKMTKLELGGKKLDEEYDQLQKSIDQMRLLVYKSHEPIRKELPCLDIPHFLPFSNSGSPVFKQPFSQALQIDQKPLAPSRGVAMKKVTPISPNRNLGTQSDGTSQEVVALEQVKSQASVPLPPLGNLLRPSPRTNDVVYVMKMSFFGVWLRGRVIEVITNTSAGTPMVHTLYKVKMEIQGNRKQFSIKTVSGRHMAYPNPSPVRLPVGTRVIAVFQDDDQNQARGGSYYSGLIAEPPKSNNGFRYLVFFDDGYAQYVYHNNILVVCDSSRNVWDDIHPDSREFIRQYLEKYPERPMVKLAPNQIVKTEWNGKWWIARVVEVEGSLVKMSFDADKRTEWIYRGSTRLAPLYTELAHQQARKESSGGNTFSRMRGMGMRRVNQPYVEYTQNTGAEDDTSEPQASAPATTVRAVAKKSTSKRHETYVVPFTQTKPEDVGVVKELQLPKDAPMPKRYQSHTCSPLCIEWIKYYPNRMLGVNPLSIPLYCGWQRELPKFRKKSTIMYTAPCGRRLRCMEDLHRYLRVCKSNMAVDLFDFDYWVNALSVFTLSDRIKKHIFKEDITFGKENVKIPVVNYVDHTLPSNLTYSTKRLPYKGVKLNVDPDFLCGCDCTDDCQNKEKCACWQLTIQGSSLGPGGLADPNVGYYYKRLQERVITGIYECNAQCKCSKTTCLNRVVQHPLQLQLQLFKTPSKGWGLRCINDIPKGTFICIYAGYLYTEQTANQVGEQDGDDYLAELDYIEVVESMKEDYESDVEDDELEEEEEQVPSPKSGRDYENDNRRGSRNKSREEFDADFKAGWRSTNSDSGAAIRARLRKRSAADMDSEAEKGSKRREGDDDTSDDDKMERTPSSFTPKPLKKPGKAVEQPVHRFQSVRKFYGPNERVYIMDANKVGNIGRYLNHSCSPNVFVQNVFVDTHDLRFPWVAFFTLTYVRAGTELTWDYNYNVGSVPDKTIICRCGSQECRGRLL